MNKIVMLIGIIDFVFRCMVYLIGSFEDGSKIGEVDEFDFIFCFNYFLEECMFY